MRRSGFNFSGYLFVIPAGDYLLKSSDQKITAIIPARGGSKSIPRKNIALLGGRPLIGWTIEGALKCSLLDRVIVSTEDEEIAEISRNYGAEVPFIRPLELSQDSTPDMPVCRHALEWLSEHEDYHPDIIVWLRPTCPLRRAEDIEAVVDKLIKSGADGVRSVSISDSHPYWMKRFENDRLVPFVDGKEEQSCYRRQLLPPVYSLNGAVDAVWSERVFNQDSLFCGDICGYVMPAEFGVDIDDELDFILAESLLTKLKI